MTSAMLIFLLGGTVSYLLGAIPFGLLLARLKGLDIRQHGSGNIGATNVFRCAGKTLGVTVFILDAIKGFLPAFLFPHWVLHAAGSPGDPAILSVVYAALAVLGHVFPVYLRFRGGKGIATSAGALAGIAWQAVLLAAAVWLLLFLTLRYVSLASIGAAMTILLSGWFFYPDTPLRAGALSLLGLLAIWRHRSNLARLRTGTENRFEFRRQKEKAV